jgi:hypothetical protein
MAETEDPMMARRVAAIRLVIRQQRKRKYVRAAAEHMKVMMDVLGSEPEFIEAKKKIDEALMWALKGITAR